MNSHANLTQTSPVFAANYETALTTISDVLIVNQTTAATILKNTTDHFDPEQAYHLITRFLPSVVDAHLHLFQLGEKLHYVTEVGEYKHLFNPYVHECVERMAAHYESVCFHFTPAFRNFYQTFFFAQIQTHLGLVLFGLQALHQQLSVFDFRQTYTIMQTLTEQGMQELEGFTWHCKGHRMYEILDGKNTSTTPIHHARYSNIPQATQVQLAAQNDFPQYLIAAHAALQDILLVAKEQRLQILQSSVADSLKLLPHIARVLLTKSIYVKLDSWPQPISNASFKIRLLYNDFPVEKEQDFYWARRIMFDKFHASTAELFVSPALIERVKYVLPEMTCFAKESCYGIVRQEHNINEYQHALDEMAQGLPLPALNFRYSLPLRLPLPSTLLARLDDTIIMPAALSAVWIAAAALVGRYVIKSCYRQCGFWRQSGQGHATHSEQLAAAISLQPLLPVKNNG